TVTDTAQDAAGRWIALDRSAFYPTAGGQPHDTGTIAGLAVLDVKSQGGIVWHLVTADAVPAAGSPVVTSPGAATADSLGPGTTVVGRIDWARRFTHMQRHTGQHLLSQAFLRVGKALGDDFGTKSVSLRGADCTLDLAGDPANLDAAACAAAEAEANEAARQAMPVTAFEVEEEHLHEFKLRRPSKVGGLVRLVAIGDYDLVACGGTHVRNSAELLPVAVLGSERVRGGLTRVTFRVGAEAVADAAAKHAVINELGTALSSRPAELPAQVGRLRAELAEARSALEAAHASVASYLADDALAAGSAITGAMLVRLVLRDQQAGMLTAVLDRMQTAAGVVALCAAVEGDTVRFAFTAGPGTDIDVRPALAAALVIVDGRGGGRPDRAMGAGAKVTRTAEALEAAARVLGADAS
ncbi:MAG TPA: DHHA1 domain-containing protein, partial [Trueperaceae bacterium]|nr:DHHA1 domain-containing protein [Trueperaceae bacterium]